MKFLFIEPFFGGSHREFARGLVSSSVHHIDLITLPARFWKWRMRGASLYLIKKIESLECYDGLICTNLMSLADFKALSGKFFPPAVVYFHENQITYPLASGEHRDFQFGFTDITTALAADRVIFNSKTHFNAFFSKLPAFLKMMPEFLPVWVTEEIRAKSTVIYPGCMFDAEPDFSLKNDLPPLIIWNHRWEFDKNPSSFFSALDALLEKGLDFRLALVGENFQKVPKDFLAAKEKYKGKIIQYGFIESREKYFNLLARGAVVISTANQENFGMSIVEAVRYGCIPLLPDRLSYPEIIPDSFHKDFLYKSQEELMEKLISVIINYPCFQDHMKSLSNKMDSFAWENIIDEYDTELENL